MAITGLSACATFSDDNLAARVGDFELTQEEFSVRAQIAAAPDSPVVSGDAARQVITNWIYLSAARTSGLMTVFEQGPETSGFACLNLIPAADQLAAEAILDRLQNGERPEVVAAELESDQVRSGALGCNQAIDYGEEALLQMAGMSSDDPHRIVTVSGSTFVLSLQTEDQIDAGALLTLVSTVDPEALQGVIDTIQTADVYVDPRFGSFDVDAGSVVPLG